MTSDKGTCQDVPLMQQGFSIQRTCVTVIKNNKNFMAKLSFESCPFGFQNIQRALLFYMCVGKICLGIAFIQSVQRQRVFQT